MVFSLVIITLFTSRSSQPSFRLSASLALVIWVSSNDLSKWYMCTPLSLPFSSTSSILIKLLPSLAHTPFCVLNTSPPCIAWLRISLACNCASGAPHSPRAIMHTAINMAVFITEPIICKRDIPAACITTSSLFEASAPKPVKPPISAAIGKNTTKSPGIV